MSHEITIILAKASWCPHCVDFTPIYEIAQSKLKPNQVDNCNINFISFELDDNSQKNRFLQEYPGLIDFLEGYPTVYFQMKELNGGSRAKTEFINHTISKQQNKQGLDEAATEFIQNIVNKYKSIKSGKSEYVQIQKGGMINYKTSMNEEEYRNKYLKYKSKYLNLRTNKNL